MVSVGGGPRKERRARRRILIRLLYRFLATVRTGYWFVFRPRTRGVKCIVECDGKWLMIRNTYGRGHWTFPGGAVKRREQPEQAVVREVAEEVGIELGSVRDIGSFHSRKQYKRDTVHCFVAAVDSAEYEIDHREILEAAWTAPADIPDFRSGSVDRALQLLEADR